MVDAVVQVTYILKMGVCLLKHYLNQVKKIYTLQKQLDMAQTL